MFCHHPRKNSFNLNFLLWSNSRFTENLQKQCRACAPNADTSGDVETSELGLPSLADHHGPAAEGHLSGAPSLPGPHHRALQPRKCPAGPGTGRSGLPTGWGRALPDATVRPSWTLATRLPEACLSLRLLSKRVCSLCDSSGHLAHVPWRLSLPVPWGPLTLLRANGSEVGLSSLPFQSPVRRRWDSDDLLCPRSLRCAWSLVRGRCLRAALFFIRLLTC